jgi:two-component system, NarL family, nitrate/nitrite response regulator NarL
VTPTQEAPVVIEEFSTVDDVRARLSDRAASRPSVVVGPSSADAAATVLAAGGRGYLLAGRKAAPGSSGARVAVPGRLSAREVEVLQGLADGLSTGQLAAELGLSPLTIKSHLARITKRLDARNRVHAVLIALQEGLIR